MATLIARADLQAHLRHLDVQEDTVVTVSKLVNGWLRQDTDNSEIPIPLPENHPLYSAAFELMVLEISNPERLASKTVGPTSRTWPIKAERDAIREGVRRSWGRSKRAARGSFPPAPRYPDPALPSWHQTCHRRPW